MSNKNFSLTLAIYLPKARIFFLLVYSLVFFQVQAQTIKLQKQGEYSFITGGLSDEEQTYLQEQSPKYPIQLIFRNHSEITGVKDVVLRVKNVSGDLMVETKTTGPFLYLNPPASGRFTFEADMGEETISMTKDLIGRRYLRLVFDFNKAKAE